MVEQLFLKPENTPLPTMPVDVIDASLQGIVGSRNVHPLKQVLMLPQNTLQDFKLQAGQLREDIIIDVPFDFHALGSGTVIRLGSAELRLTFHCEPCAKIKHFINPKKVVHRRGYHSQIIKAGVIALGDKLTVLSDRFDPIPYSLADRIKWYLERHPKPIFVTDLVEEIALSTSYCRAVPNAIRHRDDIDTSLILYKSKRRR